MLRWFGILFVPIVIGYFVPINRIFSVSNRGCLRPVLGRSLPAIEEIVTTGEITYSNAMPSRTKFKKFFDSVVPVGDKMNLRELCEHELVQTALSDGLLVPEDIEYVWDSEILPSERCLDEDGAFEMFCMLSDLPDPEVAKHLQESFVSLSQGQGFVSHERLFSWDLVVEGIQEGLITESDINLVSVAHASSLGDGVSVYDRRAFGKIHRSLVELLQEKVSKLESSQEPVAES